MNSNVLPTNVKQIGSIGDGMRVYMEDYVFTYLSQYANAGGYDERIALLVGRYLLIDGYPILFVNGAIQGKHTAERDGLLYFTEQTDAYASEMIAEFFEGMEIVGWMQTQPGYGIYLNQQYAGYHFKNFPKVNQVMFVIDPLEGVNAFYTYNEDRSALEEVRGYFIYYDKNTNMHEYMLSNKAVEPDFTAKEASFVEIPKISRVEDEYQERAEESVRKRQKERTSKKTVKEQKRALNLLVSMSAVLFVVCFVLGTGLVQSQNRLESMESQILQLSTAYRALNSQAANPVFAPSETAMVPTESIVSDAANLTDIEEEYFTVDDEQPGYEQASNVAEPEASEQRQQTLEIDGIPVQPAINASITPSATPSVTPTERTIPETYSVQPGDSLSQISIRFYGYDRVSEILALNGITDPNVIIAGTVLQMP